MSNLLKQVRRFSHPFYLRVGEYHGWDHIQKVRLHALNLAKNYKEVDRFVLAAACYLHDIGRSVKDESHEEESIKLAKPFLEKLNVEQAKVAAICHAIECHTKEGVVDAKTVEAKLLFDADKLEIMSVYGFLRVTMFLVQERKMELSKAIDFLWKYVKEVRSEHLQIIEARRLVDPELRIIRTMVAKFKNWEGNKQG